MNNSGASIARFWRATNKTKACIARARFEDEPAQLVARAGLKLDEKMLSELTGSTCRVEYDLPSGNWPFQGYPAFAVVVAVDMPMIKIKSTHASDDEDSIWINTKFIKQISIWKKH